MREVSLAIVLGRDYCFGSYIVVDETRGETRGEMRGETRGKTRGKMSGLLGFKKRQGAD